MTHQAPRSDAPEPAPHLRELWTRSPTEMVRRSGQLLRKSLGQHFLIDRNLRDAVVEDARVQPGDQILEVGVGTGVLTARMLEKGARVLGVEIDERMLRSAARNLGVPHHEIQYIAAPTGRAGTPPLPPTRVPAPQRPPLIERTNPELIACSGLDKRKNLHPAVADWLSRHTTDSHPLKLVANLPYQVGSTVVLAALEWRPNLTLDGGGGGDRRRGFDAIGVMLQREVAERLIARPGTSAYGALSVLMQAHAGMQIARSIAPQVFVPPPKVRSAFVVGVVWDPIGPAPRGLTWEGYARFKVVVQAAFQHRRKRLRKTLAMALQLPADLVDSLLERLSIVPDTRAETVDVDGFLALAAAFGPHLATPGPPANGASGASPSSPPSATDAGGAPG